MTDKDLLEDEEFIRIQRLNSVESETRPSIAYETKLPDLGASKNLASNSPPIEKKIEYTDELLKIYLKNLHLQEKRRFHNESIVSFFGDVDFDTRPTILDGAINEPYLNSFSGPVLEKQIKEFEKTKKEIAEKINETVDDKEKVTIRDTFEQNLKVSPLQPYSNVFNSNFSGAYVMIWMILGLIGLRGMVDYYIANEGDLKNIEIFNLMISDWNFIWPVDLMMYLSTYFVLFIQWLCKKNLINWKKTGMKISIVYELAFVILWNYFVQKVLKLHWIARIFFYLHSIVLLMKMHSYSMFNGYLWNIQQEFNFSKSALAKYKDVTSCDIVETLKRSQEFCKHELNSQTTSTTNKKFPENLTLSNYFMYTVFPTLVYQFEYPRTKNIRWSYVFEKVCAIFGTIFLMILVAQFFMFPPAQRAINMRDYPWPTKMAKFKEWGYLVAEFVPAMTVIYILVFYLIWDAILNCNAELTTFADRYFYGDWWNCVSWAEFSRIWNVPVHKFLLRHVYHSSMNHWKLNKLQATLFTFILSAVFHEASMYAIFQRFRPFIFLFQLAQLPMAYVTTLPLLQKRPVLCNVLFWMGVCSGPSVICALYIMY